MGRSSSRATFPAAELFSAAGMLVCLVAAVGCRSSSPAAEDLEAVTRGAVTAGSGGTAPLWNGLVAALEDGEDELARVLVERLRPWVANEEERERLLAFERVLDGRELVRLVSLRLISEPTDTRGRHRIVLLASQAGDRELVLRLPPARLTQARTAVNEVGGLARDLRTSHVDELTELVLVPGRTTRIVLATSDIRTEAALAVRERWSLRALSGQIERGDVSLPATGVVVAPCERVRLADHLPLAPVPVEELVRYAREAEIRTPPLLERAVRVPSTQREGALRTLAPLVQSWSTDDPERVEKLAPALRWLTDGGQSGLSAREWAAVIWRELETDARPRLDFADDGRRDLELGGGRGTLSGP